MRIFFFPLILPLLVSFILSNQASAQLDETIRWNKQLWKAIESAAIIEIDFNGRNLNKEDRILFLEAMQTLLNDAKPIEKNYPYYGDPNKLATIQIHQIHFSMSFTIGSNGNSGGFRIMAQRKINAGFDSILPIHKKKANATLMSILKKYKAPELKK